MKKLAALPWGVDWAGKLERKGAERRKSACEKLMRKRIGFE
jgi:hypothetical protein